MKRLLCAAVAAAVCASAFASYTIFDGRLSRSSIYPGTTHTYKICVPDSYTGTEAVPLYVGLDGILCNAPERIDSLSSLGEIPPMISVYLQPGYIADTEGNTVRYNRSNEFDATDGRFAEFLEKELLPAVSNTVLPDGRRIVLSPKPEERMIFGLSSGGIAAFNAAWQRPDLFGKVYSGCGTFVPMRGGNDLQAIVRKHEPLPLRIFLQDGFTDTWNPIFGSWYEANRVLASALEFAGYDMDTDWAEGGHSVVRTSAIFPEVMKWMWRDYPAPLATGATGNGLLEQLLLPGEGWTQENLSISVAPAEVVEAVYPDASLVAVYNPGSNYLDQYILTPEGDRRFGQRFYWLHTYDNSALKINSMAFDADGWLWALTKAGIQICDQNGRVRGIIRLPRGFDAERGVLRIADGVVTIADPTTQYSRKFNVRAAAGERPSSQGAA